MKLPAFTITKVRIVWQAFFLCLFFFLLFVTDLRYLKGWPVSIFLETDPLVALATSLATHSLYEGLVWSLVILVPTLVFGRFYCNWVCPLGILHHIAGSISDILKPKERIESNRYKSHYNLKYYILVFLLAAAALGSLQIGVLDPICLLVRSATGSVLPAVNMGAGVVYVNQKFYYGAWLIGGLLFLILILNRWILRYWCRALCPLGALLGLLSKFSLFRIDRDPEKCTDCDLCLQNCQGASDPHLQIRASECFVCMDCVEVCPTDALSYKFMPDWRREVKDSPGLERRRLVTTMLAGAIFLPVARASGAQGALFNDRLIRPPGSVKEDEFLKRCIKCDECIRVCPTNVLQPAMLEAGLEGFWTPIMINRLGYCELNCVLCGQVCPTGAIQRIPLEAKVGVGDYAGKPVKVGTAFYDYGRCLPWAMHVPCVVCEEVCPTSPKAIFAKHVELTGRDGKPVALKQPYVEPELCIGCGICEHECPVKDDPAVYVTAIGETRSKERSLLL